MQARREAGKASRAPQLVGLSTRLLIALRTTGDGHGGHKPYHYRKVTLFTKVPQTQCFSFILKLGIQRLLS